MTKSKSRKATSREILDNARQRATKQRALLLDVIRENDGHLDADELYQKARRYHRTINLSTVYRNLQLFKKLGLIEERHFTEDHHHYEAKQGADHQHLRCNSCGKIVEFACPLSTKFKDRVAQEYSFIITGVEVSMTGVCLECRQKELADRQ